MTGDVIELFRAAAHAHPHRVALSVGDESLTYERLDRWSDAIAARLGTLSPSPTRVALPARKAPHTYAAILGILKARCAYVPLPAEGPAARWSVLLERCAARVVVDPTGEVPGPVRLDVLPEGQPAEPKGARPEDEAYTLFTSGSTGVPKGVRITRGNLAAYVHHARTLAPFTAEDRFTQFFALTFDLSVHDLFVPWSIGAQVCVPGDAEALTPAAFVRRCGITVWFSAPSVLALMSRTRTLTAGALPSVRQAFFCGEALPMPAVEAFRLAAPAAKVTNLYGPTETTIAISAYPLPGNMREHGDIAPIGRLFPGHRHRIVDGELLVTGPQLSPGYVNDPGADAAAFIQDNEGVRWYRTGDRVEEDAHGILHFRGRRDDQVKILGHRVEPGEVDAAVRSFLEGGDCATVPMNGPSGTRLVTFIDAPCDRAALLRHLQEHLPAYMLPDRIIALDALPLTAHGKVDRHALKALAAHG